jgi:hypothetical protein
MVHLDIHVTTIRLELGTMKAVELERQVVMEGLVSEVMVMEDQKCRQNWECIASGC